MAVDEASVVAIEIENVDDKVPLLFEREDVFYSSIEKRNVEVISSVVGAPGIPGGAGGAMRIPMEIKPGSAFGYWDPNGGDMGRGDGSTYNAAVISANNFILRVEWTYQSQISTDDQRKAVINNFKRLLSKSMAEFRTQIDRQCMTAGNGVLANPNAVSIGGGTGGGDLWTVPATDGFGVRLLRNGQPVGIYDTTLATKKAEVKINFIDYPNRQVSTFPSLAGALTTDKIVASGLLANPVGLYGVPYHYSAASTGTWLGFNRANTPEIRANRVNAGGALALPFARLAVNKVGDRVGMEEMSKCTAWMHPCQKQAYEELGQLMTILNQQPGDGKLNLYFGDNMQMAGCPVKTSYSWDKTRIDFITADIWGRAELNPAKFYEVGGQKLFPLRGASGGLAAASIFYLVANFNLFINNPPKASFIDGLAIPSGY